MKKAVFIGAHTDDEMICAGTLRKLVKSGAEVKVIAFSCAPIPDKSLKRTWDIVRLEFLQSMKSIGVLPENRIILNYDARTLSNHHDKIRQLLYNYTVNEKPDLALILSSEDDHQDHAIVGKSAERVMKNRVPMVIRCHYPWNFINPGRSNLFVKLTPDEFEAKLNVIRAYKSQHFRYDYENLFTALTRANGLATKNELAEAFEIAYLITG
ncbi:MAG: PIG-L family deacetylase [bacterium]|nr:PIG-L family deacetylase [bacterium]